jgi:hypothetical protein
LTIVYWYAFLKFNFQVRVRRTLSVGVVAASGDVNVWRRQKVYEIGGHDDVKRIFGWGYWECGERGAGCLSYRYWGCGLDSGSVGKSFNFRHSYTGNFIVAH